MSMSLCVEGTHLDDHRPSPLDPKPLYTGHVYHHTLSPENMKHNCLFVVTGNKEKKEIAFSGTYNLNWGEKIQMCQIQDKVEAAGHNSIEGVDRNDCLLFGYWF